MNQRRGQHRSCHRAGGALALVLALAGCRDEGPRLLLELRALPREATAVTVELASPSWRFEGHEVPAGPVAVRYPKDTGTLVLEIDRGYLAERQDRLRLPLAVPQRLPLDAHLRASLGSAALAATTSVTAVPGQNLHVVLQASRVGAGPDGGAAADASTPAPGTDARPAPLDAGAAEAARDQALPETAQSPPDAPDAAAPPDTAPGEATCKVSPLRPASVGRPTGDPSIVFAGSVYGIAWAEGAEVKYNAMDPEGQARFGTFDVVAMRDQGMSVYRTARLAHDRGVTALVAGRQDAGGAAGVSTRLILPLSGSTGGGGLLVAPDSPGAPEVGGVAFQPDGRLAVVSYPATASSQARLDLVERTLSPARSLTGGLLQKTLAVAVSWMDEGRFAVAYVTSYDLPTKGMVATFDRDLLLGKNFPFTSGDDRPSTTGAGATVSVAAGGGDRAVVAWIGSQGCPGCTTNRELFLSLVAPGTGVLLSRAAVTGDGSDPKLFPRVVFDGLHFVVLWSEYASSTSARVRMRRYDQTLTPLGPPLDLSAGAPMRPTGGADIAVEGRGRYGVVMPLFTERHHFTRIVCGP